MPPGRLHRLDPGSEHQGVARHLARVGTGTTAKVEYDEKWLLAQRLCEKGMGTWSQQVAA